MLDPHEKIILDRTAEMTQENNQILHKLLRAHRWSQFSALLYWLLILGSMVGAYYYLQPYLDTLISAYQKVSKTLPELDLQLPSLPAPID